MFDILLYVLYILKTDIKENGNKGFFNKINLSKKVVYLLLT